MRATPRCSSHDSCSRAGHKNICSRRWSAAWGKRGEHYRPVCQHGPPPPSRELQRSRNTHHSPAAIPTTVQPLYPPQSSRYTHHSPAAIPTIAQPSEVAGVGHARRPVRSKVAQSGVRISRTKLALAEQQSLSQVELARSPRILGAMRVCRRRQMGGLEEDCGARGKDMWRTLWYGVCQTTPHPVLV
jgi:hypothetical protein